MSMADSEVVVVAGESFPRTEDAAPTPTSEGALQVEVEKEEDITSPAINEDEQGDSAPPVPYPSRAIAFLMISTVFQR